MTALTKHFGASIKGSLPTITLLRTSVFVFQKNKEEIAIQIQGTDNFKKRLW